MTMTMAQVFDISAVSAIGVNAKLNGEILLTDSVFYVKVGPDEQTKRISNRPDENTIYVTDGTAVDKMTIARSPGKIIGVKYDYLITYQQDMRFGGQRMVYYCTKRD